MNVSFRWLAELANLPPDVTPVQLAERMTRSIVEIDGVSVGAAGLACVVVGRITEVADHPQADRLGVATVDIGQAEEMTVVFGKVLPLAAGDLVPVAVGPCELPNNVTVRAGEIRGVASAGMVCVDEELGMDLGGQELADPKHPGKFIHLTRLPKGTPVGVTLGEALGRDDATLEISSVAITNRPDLWGHYGLAREIAALWGTPLVPLKAAKLTPGKAQPLPVDLQTPLCRRYLGARVDGVVVAPSPAWLSSRLQSIGIRPINNVVDATNYVMAELGQPLHAFDAASFIDGRIEVREVGKPEKFVTLDGQARQVPAGSLLICAKNAPVAIAGIMGGQASQISDGTTSIIIESANFDPLAVRRTATALGLRTEASARFEKDLDPAAAELAMHRVLALLKQLCPSCHLAGPIADVGEVKAIPAVSITTTAAFVSERLGVPVAAADIASLLKPLGFVAKKGRGDSLAIAVPSWRAGSDVGLPEDIVEEVGRRLGYDRLTPQLPARPLAAPQTKYVIRLVRQLKAALAGRFEFTEASTYSFSLPSPLAISGGLKVQEPPAAHLSELRQSIAPNLVSVVAQNIRQQPELALFEIGRVFRSGAGSYDLAPDSTAALPPQPRILGLVLTSPQPDGTKLFRQLKGVAEQLLLQSGYQPSWVEIVATPTYAPWLDLGTSIRVEVQGEDIGFVSLAPAEALSSAKVRQPVAVAEIDVTRLAKIAPATHQYHPIPKFPSVVEDVSLLVDQSQAWASIEQFCAGYHPLISSVELFDVYEGRRSAEAPAKVDSKIGAGKRSLAFHLTFSSPERTLTAEEVQDVVRALAKDLTKKFKAEVR